MFPNVGDVLNTQVAQVLGKLSWMVMTKTGLVGVNAAFAHTQIQGSTDTLSYLLSDGWPS